MSQIEHSIVVEAKDATPTCFRDIPPPRVPLTPTTCSGDIPLHMSRHFYTSSIAHHNHYTFKSKASRPRDPHVHVPAAFPSTRCHHTSHFANPIMSTLSISDLEFVSREDLAKQIRSTPSASGVPSNFAVIDVRDSDHIGGHIKGSTWVPCSTLDHKTPELIRTLKDKDVVVFHCALSQQRGPSAALRYLREKERLHPGSLVGVEGGEDGIEKDGREGESKEGKKQKVVVLKGGFTEWQEKYGRDEGLTEGWERDVWEFGGPEH